MKVLFVSPYVPDQIRVRPYNFLKGLAGRGHEVTLLTVTESKSDEQALEPLRGHLDEIATFRAGRLRRGWNALSALPTRHPIQSRYSWHPALAIELTRRLKNRGSGRYDVVHVEHLRGSIYAELAADGAPVVWDSVDCISDLFEVALRNYPPGLRRSIFRLELPRTRRHEARLVNRVDKTIVTTDVDRASLVRIAGLSDETTRVDVVPNGVDLDRFHPAEGERVPGHRLVMTGKMSYHANEVAALRLVDDIMPKVWKVFPGAHVQLVGKDPSGKVRSLGDDPRVTVTGRVDDTATYLREATVAVAATRYGAGVQNKVLEALACGTPVVASEAATRGIGIEILEFVPSAVESEGIADHIVQLLSDPQARSRLGRQGRAAMEMSHNWSRSLTRLERIYHELVDDSQA